MRHSIQKAIHQSQAYLIYLHVIQFIVRFGQDFRHISFIIGESPAAYYAFASPWKTHTSLPAVHIKSCGKEVGI